MGDFYNHLQWSEHLELPEQRGEWGRLHWQRVKKLSVWTTCRKRKELTQPSFELIRSLCSGCGSFGTLILHSYN